MCASSDVVFKQRVNAREKISWYSHQQVDGHDCDRRTAISKQASARRGSAASRAGGRCPRARIPVSDRATPAAAAASAPSKSPCDARASALPSARLLAPVCHVPHFLSEHASCCPWLVRQWPNVTSAVLSGGARRRCCARTFGELWRNSRGAAAPTTLRPPRGSCPATRSAEMPR